MAGAFVLLSILPQKNEVMINVGTYGESIYRYSFDTESLEFTAVGKAEAANGSYVIERDGKVYAVREKGDDSGITSFAAEPEMKKDPQIRKTGADPCFIMAAEGKDGKGFIMTADYSGGSVSVFPITEDGLGECSQTLEFEGNGPIEGRQESPHIHQLKQVPGYDGRWIAAADLGSDRIRLIEIEENGDFVLSHSADIECPAGSGPRHMEFGKDGNILYCLCELSGEVLVYEIGTGKIPSFTLVQRIQADEVDAGGSADIHLHPSGRHLYTSHRLDNDGIAIFNILEDGSLEKTGYTRTSRHPRNFWISQDGSLLLAACRDDRMIQVFSIEKDGSLTLTPSVLIFENDMPSSITSL